MGSLSDDKGDGNENGKKSKTSNFARAQVTVFVDYFAVDARLGGNFLHVSFMENLNTGQQFSFSFF